VRFWNPTRPARAIRRSAAAGEGRTPKLASIPGCCCDRQSFVEAASVAAVPVAVVSALDPLAWLEEPHPPARTAAQPTMAIAAIWRTGGQGIGVA
jgi:hypothetical protein